MAILVSLALALLADMAVTLAYPTEETRLFLLNVFNEEFDWYIPAAVILKPASHVDLKKIFHGNSQPLFAQFHPSAIPPFVSAPSTKAYAPWAFDLWAPYETREENKLKAFYSSYELPESVQDMLLYLTIMGFVAVPRKTIRHESNGRNPINQGEQGIQFRSHQQEDYYAGPGKKHKNKKQSTPWLHSLIGPPGPPGRDGINGINGKNGVNGKDGTDGIPGVVGPPGLAGHNGLNGAPGPQGFPGAPGAQGVQGVQGVAGPQGTQGNDGKDGSDGTNGKDGTPGAAGPAGPPGTPGQNGRDGTNGPPGPPGLPGTPGQDGRDGMDGRDGQDGSPGLPGSPGTPGKDGQDGSHGGHHKSHEYLIPSREN